MNNIITINKEDYIPIENIPNGNCLFYSLAFFDVGNDKRKIEKRAKEIRQDLCNLYNSFYHHLENKKPKKIRKVFTQIDKRYEKILSTKIGNETIFDIMKLIESVDVEDDGVSHGKKICQNAIYASENDMQLLSLLLQRDIILYSYEGKIRKFPSERRKFPKANLIAIRHIQIGDKPDGNPNHYEALKKIDKNEQTSEKTRKKRKLNSPSSSVSSKNRSSPMSNKKSTTKKQKPTSYPSPKKRNSPIKNKTQKNIQPVPDTYIASPTYRRPPEAEDFFRHRPMGNLTKRKLEKLRNMLLKKNTTLSKMWTDIMSDSELKDAIINVHDVHFALYKSKGDKKQAIEKLKELSSSRKKIMMQKGGMNERRPAIVPGDNNDIAAVEERQREECKNRGMMLQPDPERRKNRQCIPKPPPIARRKQYENENMEEEKPIEIDDEDLPPDNDDSNENTYINAVAKFFDPFTQKQKDIEKYKFDTYHQTISNITPPISVKDKINEKIKEANIESTAKNLSDEKEYEKFDKANIELYEKCGNVLKPENQNIDSNVIDKNLQIRDDFKIYRRKHVMYKEEFINSMLYDEIYLPQLLKKYRKRNIINFKDSDINNIIQKKKYKTMVNTVEYPFDFPPHISKNDNSKTERIEYLRKKLNHRYKYKPMGLIDQIEKGEDGNIKSITFVNYDIILNKKDASGNDEKEYITYKIEGKDLETLYMKKENESNRLDFIKETSNCEKKEETSGDLKVVIRSLHDPKTLQNLLEKNEITDENIKLRKVHKPSHLRGGLKKSLKYKRKNYKNRSIKKNK